MATQSNPGEILRAAIFHTPRNPFVEAYALEWHEDGGLLIQDGQIAACGDYAGIRAAHPESRVTDMRGGYLLPGLVDTHVHFPQVRVLGSLGHCLLDWLEQCALPEESRMADAAYARRVADIFVRALSAHGTTTALVFGAHFVAATAELFQAASAHGLRVCSGLVLSDRALREDLHQAPAQAYQASTDLIRRYHGAGRLRYAVTPRFALSTTEAMLEVCQSLMRENHGVLLQTHMNENLDEIQSVARLFPWASDYLAVYERFGLCGPASVIAHNIHPQQRELERLAATRATVAHCPSSNFALGSGLFPLRRHLEAGVQCALGTDVGGGVGFGILKEALHAYMMQRVTPDGYLLDAASLLYLGTLAGAQALGLGGAIGDFTPGKRADVVYLRPPPGSPLAFALEGEELPERILSILFTLAGQESVREVRVDGFAINLGFEINL